MLTTIRGRALVGCLALALLLLVATLATPGQPLAQKSSGAKGPALGDKSWYEAAEPLHIAGPINFVGTRGLGAYLITTPAGHTLLGNAMPPSGPLIESSIRKLGYKPEEIRLLLSPHAHIDHVGSLAYMKKVTGASVATMDRDVDLLASGGKADYLYAAREEFQFPPVTTDRVLKDGEIVELGGVRLTARLTAGHTRGCTTYVTVVQDGGRSYLVVFLDGLSINPGTKLVNGPSYPGILADYRRTMSTLESLKPDIYLSYHTDAFDFPSKRARAATEGAKAFVDPEGYRRWIAEQKEKLERLAAQEKGY